MSADNQEFSIPFEESRRGANSSPEQKAALGRLGRYLGSRAVNRPTIGERRRGRGGRGFDLPTGGKPGTRNPTGSRRDVDGDGWADEGTTKPVWVGIEGQGGKPASPARRSEGSVFSPSGDEQGDRSSALSSGKKYQEIVDAQPPLSEDKKQSINDFFEELSAEEFQKADVYELDTRPKPPRPPGMPEPKPVQLIQDDEERKLEKQRVRDLFAKIFEGEMTLDKDVIITGDDGKQLNIGKRVLIEVVPQPEWATSLKIDKVSEKDLAEQDELQLYERNLEESDLLSKLEIGFRIKPLPEYNDRLIAMFDDEDKRRFVSRDDGTPALATSYRTFMQISGDDKDVRMVSHDSFYVTNRAQGQGIGSTFNARNEQIYKELDVRSIITWGASGGGSTGAVHWPKNGFSWAGEKDKQGFIKLIDDTISKTPELFSDEDRKKISSLYSKDEDTGLFETEATAEELVDFATADKVFHDAGAQFFYTRPLRELAGALPSRDSSRSLSSGKNTRDENVSTSIVEQTIIDEDDPEFLNSDGDFDVDAYSDAIYDNVEKIRESFYNLQKEADDSYKKLSKEKYPDGKVPQRFAEAKIQMDKVFGDSDFFGEPNPVDRSLVVARDSNNNIVGAARFRRGGRGDNDNLFIHHMASYGKESGIDNLGSSVFRDILKIANDDNTGISLESTPGSKEYWESMGFRDIDPEKLILTENAYLAMSSEKVRELYNNADSATDSRQTLSSGKAPRYPREPTLGAFLGDAEKRFDGVSSWEEFKERYNETEMVFLDYETTGLTFDEFGKASSNGKPIQIGLARIKNGKEIGRLNLYMNPEESLGEWSLKNLKDADGNPITNEWLATQMPMAEAHRQVAEFIGPNAIIGVQNATFDKNVLEDALSESGIDWRPSGYLDTRDISAMTLPVWSEESPEGPYTTDRDGNKKPSSSLAAITKYLDVELGEGHHNADADAFATSQVMQKIIDRAIENRWSTDVLDKEKRDAKLKADNDKFNTDVEKFEKDKADFLTPQEYAETSAETETEQGDIFKRRLRPIRPTKEPLKKPSPEAMAGRVASDDSLYDEAYGPIPRNNRRGTRMPRARGIGEAEYDAILEMVDLARKKKKLKRASFSYGEDEFERTLQWTEDNADREVDIKIMSQELEIPLSNAYFFIGEFPEIFERFESKKRGRQKYRIRTPQEIKDYLSSGRISDNEKTSYKIRSNARNYILNQEERPIGLMGEYRARYEYHDGYSGYGGRRLGSRDENGFNQEAFEQASEDVFGKRFDTFEEMVKEWNRLQNLFEEDENYREKIKQESIEKHGYAYSPIYKNGELTANVSIDVYDDELAYNSLYNLLIYLPRGRDGYTATRNTLQKLIKDIEIFNEKKNKRFKLVYDENGSRYKLRTFNADLKKLESEELGRLRDKYQEEGMSLLDAINRAIGDLKNDERFSDDKIYLDDEGESTRLSSGANVVEAFNEPIEVTQQEAAESGSNREVLTGKKVAERIIQKIEETTETTLTDQQKRIIEREVPGLTREIAGKTLLDVEIDDAFSETGKQLLESISIDISSDGIPFVSADPIPQMAEQIPDKRDWRTVELPKRDDVISILDEAMKDTLVFQDSVWKDTDGNIVARQIYKNETSGSVLEYENDEARARFPMLEMVAPKGFVIRGDDIGLRALAQDRLPAPYLEAWKKHSQFLRELSRRAGELMGDEELFVPGSRISTSTSTYLRGYIGGITDPSKFNMGLDGKALQASHDLFGHLGTGRAFDRHGEWANDLAMFSIVDHPDSPLTPQEKLAVKHLTYMMYSAQRMLHTGRLDEQEQNQRESESFRNRPRSVFDITDMTSPDTGVAVRVYAGDFDSVVKKFDAVSTSGKLSSGRKSIYEADAKDVELALAHDALGKSDRLSSGRISDDDNQSLSSGRQRPLIPMRRVSERTPVEPGKRGVKGYGQADASGKEVRRSSTKWLAGMTSEEMSLALVPSSKEEHFEMWADDLAGTGWNKDRKYRKYLKQYYDQLDGHENALRIDYSPEGLEASRELVRSMLDSSPQMKWMFENFGAPLVGVFTRDAMNEYEGRPDVKERMELLRQQRGMEKTPFVSGLASREFGFVGLTPRALIDRESYDNVGAKYPLELDPNRKPGLREAHIDRSLHGTLIHEYGHWLHYRAIRDLETNSSGGSKTYYGSGKLDDPMYRAALDVAEEYANPDTDNEAIEIYSQFIDLTGRDAGEMFKTHPDKALLATSYGNVNKREAIAEAFVAIMHPNKDLAKNILSPKLRRDIYALAGVNPDNLPWEARPDGRPSISMSLSSGAEAKPGREKRRGRISRALRQLVGAGDESSEQEEPSKRKPDYTFEAPERPESLVSFASEPSEQLRESLPVPGEYNLSDELKNDVAQIPEDPILKELGAKSSNKIHGFGVSMFAPMEDRKASSAAKRMISLNLSQTAKIKPREFIQAFSEAEITGSGISDAQLQRRFFSAARNFKALMSVFEAVDKAQTDEERKKARRFAVDRVTGSLVSVTEHDKIIQRRFYFDEMIDQLEARSFDELFGPEWDALTNIYIGDEKSIFTPYLLTKVGGDDIKKQMELGLRIRDMLQEFSKGIRSGEELRGSSDLVVAFSPIGEVDPTTGKNGYAIISKLGLSPREPIELLKSVIKDGKIIPDSEQTPEQRKAYVKVVSELGFTDEYLRKIAEAGIITVDKSNIDSEETKELFKGFLINRLRASAGFAEDFKNRYEYTSGISFFDIDTPEGEREAAAAIVSDIIHTWAISANNSNPVALAIQHEAREMFGLDEAVGWNGGIRGLPRSGSGFGDAVDPEERGELTALEFDDAPSLSEKQRAAVRSVVSAIYEATQHYYKTKGVTHVAVWRGMKGTPEMRVPRGELKADTVSMRPLSSWTTNSSMAQAFATSLTGKVDNPDLFDDNILIKAYVPIENIFSNPLTGFGCLGEDEVVLLGRPTEAMMMTPPSVFFPAEVLKRVESDEDKEFVKLINASFSDRDKQTNPPYHRLAALDIDEFKTEFDSMTGQTAKLSSGARAKRSIPPISEIRKEVGRAYRESEMSDAGVVRQYLKNRTYDANELYESRHIDGRGGDYLGEHFSRFLDFISNEMLLLDNMSDEEILKIQKNKTYRSTIDTYDNAIDNIGPVPSKNSNRLSSGKVIKYNFVEARMRAADIKVTFNRDPERVAAVKSTLTKGFMGGFTVEVDRMDDIKEGIAIARNKHGMKVDAVADFDAEGNPSDELVDTFLAWMDFHGPKTFMEPKSGAEKTTIGGWVSDGTVYLDVVDVYPNTEENLTKAADMGLGEDQIAVTNLNKLWELLESGEDVSPAFIDSGGTGGFTLDEESVKRVSAALSDLNSNKFNTGSMQLKRIGNTKKFTKGPVSGARRVRNTDFATGEKQDYWMVAGTNGMVKVFTHEQYLKVRDRKIQGLFDKMSTQSDILASMFEAKNTKPVASMSFAGGRNVGKAKVSKEHKNRGLTSGMANLYGFSNDLSRVGIQMGDKTVAVMI